MDSKRHNPGRATAAAAMALAAALVVPTSGFGADDGVHIEVRGVNAVEPHEERRMSRDIARKLDTRRTRLGRCLSGHDEPAVTVDWTITTDGEPVDVTVFASGSAVKNCVAAAVADLRFAHLDDRHPRARVELRR